MNKSREDLITSLSSDLKTSSRAGRTIDMVVYWLLFNFTVATLLIYLTGPFRADSLQQLHNSPQFLLETLSGILAIILLSLAAFSSAIPKNVSRLKQFLPALLLLFFWFSFYLFGLWSPAVELSMIDKREIHCYIEVLLYSLPALVFGFVTIKLLWPLNGSWTGLMIGLAAGATPALIMQFACVYIPEHIIIHHLLPGLVPGVIGFFAGKYYLAR